MQNLLWYVRTLKGCERKKYDSLLLLRLVKKVTERRNMYARFFDSSELQGGGRLEQTHFDTWGNVHNATVNTVKDGAAST